MDRPTVPTKPERLYYYRRRVFFTYWSVYSWYNNPHFNNEEWHCLEEWAVCVGIKQAGDKWFGVESFYHDGHTYDQLTVFGLVFGKMYSYDARPKHEREVR